MAWAVFALAFVVFFGTHSVPVRPPVRPYLMGLLGARGFTWVYSALSLASLAWLIVAAGQAPVVPLWGWSPWQSLVSLSLMLVACELLALTLGRPNPFSFGGVGNDTFDPSQPGVVRLTRHPLLVVLAIWSLAHLLANGDVAHAILFFVFAVFSLFGGRMVDRRARRDLADRWDPLWEEVQAAPVGSVLPLRAETALRLGLGGAIFGVLIWLHPLVIGVSPWP